MADSIKNPGVEKTIRFKNPADQAAYEKFLRENPRPKDKVLTIKQKAILEKIADLNAKQALTKADNSNVNR